MASYLFDLDEDGASQPAEQSLDFPTSQAACSEAVRALSEIMAETLLSNGHSRYLAITVRDGVGAAIFKASLRYDSQVLGTHVTRVERE
ncbi:MAG: DUF6894 family protein [Phreatobacter sp.]|uniref:DUF6894 family protein n=1 Tax=Phreatobacter sp. TaxID=1966341 RepID=UPI004036C4B7